MHHREAPGQRNDGCWTLPPCHDKKPLASPCIRADSKLSSMGRARSHPGAGGARADEAHAKLRPKQVEWVHTALARGRWFLPGGRLRTASSGHGSGADAQVVARHAGSLHSFSRTGGRPLRRRSCRLWGGVYRRWRRGKVGRKPGPGWGLRRPCLTPRWSRAATRLAMAWRSAGAWSSGAHAVWASSCACASSARRSRRPAERWYGTWRGLVAPLRRRPRCLAWSRPRHRGQGWLVVSLYNLSCRIRACAKEARHAPGHGDRSDRPYLELY